MPSNSYIILFGNKKLDILINYGRRHFKLFTNSCFVEHPVSHCENQKQEEDFYNQFITLKRVLNTTIVQCKQTYVALS